MRTSRTDSSTKLRRSCRTRRLRFTSRVGQGCPDSPLLRPTSKLNCGWGIFETIKECESNLNLWYVRWEYNNKLESNQLLDSSKIKLFTTVYKMNKTESSPHRVLSKRGKDSNLANKACPLPKFK